MQQALLTTCSNIPGCIDFLQWSSQLAAHEDNGVSLSVHVQVCTQQDP